MYYPLEFQTLKHNNSSTYEQSKTYKMGISWTRRKISSISGDLVTEVTVNRDVKICGGPKRGGYSISVEAVDDFILNIHTLAKLGCALKNGMNAKTSSNHKEFSHWQQKMHEQYIKQLFTTISTSLFYGPAQNIMSGLEISPKIADGLLAAK